MSGEHHVCTCALCGALPRHRAPYGWQCLGEDRWACLTCPPLEGPRAAAAVAVAAGCVNRVPLTAGRTAGRTFDQLGPGEGWCEPVELYSDACPACGGRPLGCDACGGTGKARS